MPFPSRFIQECDIVIIPSSWDVTRSCRPSPCCSCRPSRSHRPLALASCRPLALSSRFTHWVSLALTNTRTLNTLGTPFLCPRSLPPLLLPFPVSLSLSLLHPCPSRLPRPASPRLTPSLPRPIFPQRQRQRTHSLMLLQRACKVSNCNSLPHLC